MPTLSRVHDFVLRVEGLLDSRRAVAWSVILLILQCGTMAFLVAGVHGLIVKFDKPTGTDFTSFYAAGSLADEGNPGAAYHQLDHYAAEERVAAPGIEYIYYYYPPVFLLLC